MANSSTEQLEHDKEWEKYEEKDKLINKWRNYFDMCFTGSKMDYRIVETGRNRNKTAVFICSI